MAFDLIIKPIVWLDLNEAIEWYEKESPGLGKRFFKSFEKTKENIIRSPASYPNITQRLKEYF
jgi:hypothetical protein